LQRIEFLPFLIAEDFHPLQDLGQYCGEFVAGQGFVAAKFAVGIADEEVVAFVQGFDVLVGPVGGLDVREAGDVGD
jgi:hypothetical protein